jgi:hypothetical protein
LLLELLLLLLLHARPKAVAISMIPVSNTGDRLPWSMEHSFAVCGGLNC